MSLVLIADTPEAAVSLKRILNGHELAIVSTMSAAVAELERQSFELTIIGLHFDESQMFELIREVKELPKNANKPIICFCARDTEMSRILHESLEVTTQLLGAWMYLNEHAYNVYRDPDAELRRVIDRCLTDGTRKEIQLQRVDIQKQRSELQQLRKMLQAHEWSPELKEYLGGLRHDLDVLLRDLTKLQSSAEGQIAIVESSRALKDRVSKRVAADENGLTQAERAQLSDETRQSTEEDELMGEEEAKERDGQHK